MEDWHGLGRAFNKFINEHPVPGELKGLYEPINYILRLGGKRIRPVLCLMANELFDGNEQQAMKAALAVEYFHNFTLIHDDIMDEAPLRRGQKTVHEKWDRDTAILSGDALFVKVYQKLEDISSVHLPFVLKVFNQTAIEVCEGQQLDMDFEDIAPDKLSLDRYIEMIRLKTAVLLGCSLKIGAILANASEEDTENIYQFGLNLGIAFQIQDDYLDAFANSEAFGKQLGGDIIANKKTFLLLKAYEKANDDDREQLNMLLQSSAESDLKVERMMTLFQKLDIEKSTRECMLAYHTLALEALDQIDATQEKKQSLLDLAKSLLVRAN
ncbi:MAG: isoprenyl synthetase [Verrucomicrobia bacterium]|nr:isoprenyl synthetase [Verrucomicrobiota bacterium]|tara:strand:+ start:550 stop:1527 length:978 start_codon:yes stop_codon:yes gene_type:complete